MSRSKGLKVSHRDAEKVKMLLKAQNAMASMKVRHRDGVIFPVVHMDFDLKGAKFEIVEEEFDEFETRNQFDMVLNRIGCPISSYDVVGDIAVLDIPEKFEVNEQEIGNALLKSKKHIKAVFKKRSAIEGVERVRMFEHLAGEDRTETVHIEHGCAFKVDISTVFFSPRLSYERQRIMNQVTEEELIVDMFAGVGPYSIVIAKHNDVSVLGYDINEHAVALFEENIRLNNVSDKVKAFLGNGRDAPKGVADRVIMNLPKKAREFFEDALFTLKQEGGIIHYYTSSPRNSPYDKEIDYIAKKADEVGRKVEILGKRVVRSYSPSELHVAIDVEVQV